MRWFLILMLSVMTSLGATTYTEFYCDASVSANNTNVNAGSTTGGPVYGPSVNGNWDGTSVFTPTDGSTPASTVSAGMWASVYLDAAITAVYIAQVTNVAAGANGAITLSQAAFSGTKPTSGLTGRSIRVGGCWKGPNGTDVFPWAFMAATMTNNSTAMPRCNFKNAATYSVTAAASISVNGPFRFEGYSSTPGDGGRAVIDGGSGAGFSFVSINGNNYIDIKNFIFQNNGGSGVGIGLQMLGTGLNIIGCVFHDIRQTGINLNGGGVMCVECEAYACNKNANGNIGGFTIGTANAQLIRCISHDNAGTSTHGFRMDAAGRLINCIADSNGGDGLFLDANGSVQVVGCDFYNNTGNGIRIVTAGATSLYVENSNFIKNGLFAVTNASNLRVGQIINCALGAGTQANGGGIVIPGGITEIGTVTYPANVTPWVDPANGDFRINLTQAKAAGRGAFTETQASYAGTVGYPDIGAAQSASTNSTGGGSWTFSQ